MIYELADCDLEAFMENHPDPDQVSGFSESELCQEIYGLIEALNVVHNQGAADADPNTLQVTDPKSRPKTGFIHDIKPDNILTFYLEKNQPCFRLSDFSCARVKEVVSGINGKRHSQKTYATSGAPDYRAPECSKYQTSRPYDIFSIGCVFLELLVWFTEGFAGLSAFRDSRTGPTIPGHANYDGFFKYPDGLSGKAYLRQPVLDKMVELQNQLRGYLYHH